VFERYKDHLFSILKIKNSLFFCLLKKLLCALNNRNRNVHKIESWEYVECVFIHIVHVYVFDTSEIQCFIMKIITYFIMYINLC